MLRILQENKTGDLILEPDRYKHGRSIYICKNSECVEKAKANKRYKANTKYQEILNKVKIER